MDLLLQIVKQEGNNYISGWSSPGVTNQPGFVMDRWRQSGDISDIQRFSITDPAFSKYAYLISSDRSVSDASFIRLKNISISYSISSALKRKVSMQDIRIFVLGQNLLTITDYIGLDPENQNVASSLPPLKTITCGIHLTF